MAHFAKLNDDSIVEQVIVIPNDIEDSAIKYIKNELKFDGVWIQTSYTGKIRKNFAGIGYYYDADLDAFIPPKPFDSWILNKLSCRWEAPKVKPEGFFNWDEELGDWVNGETL